MSRPAPKKAGYKRRPTRPLRRLHLEEGAAIYDQGDSSDTLYRVVSGVVHLTRPRRRKNIDPVELGPGAIFGQADLFTGAKRSESAAAASDAVLDAMRRDDVLKLIARDDEASRALLASLFGQTELPVSNENGADVTADGILLVRLMLTPSSRPLAAWIGRDPIEITRLPFVVGRLEEGDGEDEPIQDHIDLILADEKPYQLSRLHFVIDTYDGALVVRDSGSYHGTTVNNQRIGGDRGISMMPLHLGENSIIAGASDSPYCFTLLIESS
jgi:hypothetical protein